MEALKKHEIHLHNHHESQQNHPRLWVGHQGQGQGQAIEFMLPSSFDDDSSAFTYPHNQPIGMMVPFEEQSITVAPTPASISRSTETETTTCDLITPKPSTSSSITIQELDPNIILQNYVNDDEEEDDISLVGGSNKERPHVCNVCRKSYKTKTHLRRHMMIHLNSKQFSCPECGRGFNRKEHLGKHVEAVHSAVKHKCPYCGKEISRKDHLSRHIKNMHPPSYPSFLNKEAEVTIVEAKITLKRSKSRKSTLKPIPQPLRVPVMHLPSGNIISVPHKFQSQPSEPITKQQDNINKSKQKKQNQELSTHNHTVVSTKSEQNLSQDEQIKQVPFPNCSDPNRKHGSTQNNMKILKCLECNIANFTCESELSFHLKSHRPQNFSCTQCPRAYTRREKLTEHIRCFHHGQKFTCEHCGKSLSRKDHVLRHVRSIHPELLASRFSSITSGELFSENLGVPISLLMEAQNDDIDQDPSLKTGGKYNSSVSVQNRNSSSISEMNVLLRSICQYCLKVFGTSYHLSRHVESCHNGDIRPYNCLSCTRSFKRKDHLTKHIKSHCCKAPLVLTKNTKTTNNNATQLENFHQMNLNNKTGSINGCKNKDKTRPNHIKVKNKKKQAVKKSIQKSTPISSSTSFQEVQVEIRQEVEDFNLAMINSFIEVANLNVNDIDDQHQDLMLTQDLQGGSSDDKESTVAMSSFCCGHCQIEFSTRDQLLTHLQQHSSSNNTRESESDCVIHVHNSLRSIQFSNY